MMRIPGSCVSMTIRSMSSSRSLDLRMQRHRRLDRRLGVKFGRKGDLEQHVLHHVAAEGLRQSQAACP